MYEEVFHRIVLENVPNYFRIKSNLENFINKEIEKNNLPKIKSIRLARTFDEAKATHGQIILSSSDDYQKIAELINGKEFLGHKLKTRIYRIINLCVENEVSFVFKPPKQARSKP